MVNIEKFKNISLSQIEEIAINVEKMLICQYFSHPIRAIEEIFINQKAEEYNKIKKEIKNKNKNITLEDYKKENPPHFFRVYLKPVDIMSEPKGYTHLFNFGFEIYYASDINITEIQKRIIIAHELGHIVLHYKLDKELICNSDKINIELLETQAFYFAELLLKNKTNFYKDKSKITKLQYTNKQILSAIKNLYPDYNKNKIGENKT